MEKLESVRYSAALSVTGAWKGTSRDKLYDELGWESLWSYVWSNFSEITIHVHKPSSVSLQSQIVGHTLNSHKIRCKFVISWSIQQVLDIF